MKRSPRPCIRGLVGELRRLLGGQLILLTLMGCCGCAPSPSETPPPGDAPQADRADREIWEAIYIQGSKAGYGHTKIQRRVEDGRPVVHIEGLNHLVIKRYGDRIEQDIRFTSVETPDGELISFQSSGITPSQSSGRVAGDKLLIQTATRGKTTTMSIPWSPEYGGFHAAEQTLWRDPIKPGGRRKLHALEVGLYQVVAIELVAQDYEPVELLDRTEKLLRIDVIRTLPDAQTIRGIAWADDKGRIFKSRMDAMQLESFRTTKAVALDESGLAELDLGARVTVAVNRALPRPHETKRIRYRVHLEGSDPAKVFVSGVSQSARSIDPNTIELTVYAVGPDGPVGNSEHKAEPPGDDDLKPSNMIQSDDPKIVAMAREAAGEATDPWQVATALERYVNRLVTLKDFSTAFATAAEVAENPTGDCTEHAVLLAALARARGIPARLAIGLVYMQGSEAFGYHMWTEVYIGDRWIAVDGTLGKGGVGAAHLKLAHSNLNNPSALTSFLPLAQVAGRLKIEIVEVQ